MVIFDVATAFLVGGGIAWRTGGKRRDLALTAAGIGVAAPGLVFLEVYRDWDWQYLFDPDVLPPGVPAIFITVVLLAALAGHWVGGRSIKGLAAAAGVFGVYCAISLPRIPYVGTREQYFADEAPFLPMNFLILLAAVGAAAVAVMGACFLLAERTRAAEMTE